MPAKLPSEVRRRVIMLWILGHNLDNIATDTGASLGSVRNIINELRQGRIVEYGGFADYMDELRWLSQQLKSSNLNLQDAAIGITIFNALWQLSVNPAELQELIVFLKRVSPPDFPIQQFVRSALQIAKLESATNMNFQQQEAKARSLGSDVATLEATKAELGKTINSLRSTEEEARKHLDLSLSQNKVTGQALQEYVTYREVLSKASLGLNDLKPLADFVKRTTPEKAVGAALELSRIESQTGKDSAAILEDYKQKMLRNAKLDEQSIQLGREIANSQTSLRQLTQARDRQLVDNLTTQDQLGHYVGIRSRLAAKGLHIEDLGVLEGIVNEFAKYGWQPAKIIDYLRKISDLERRTEQAKQELASVEKELGAKRSAHQQITNLVRIETIEFEKLKNLESQSRTRLDQAGRQIDNSNLQIDLADTFLRLLCDSDKVKDEQLVRLGEKLQLILRTRRTILGLSVDYEPLRQQLISLLEIVLGKKLVTRDMMEEQTRALKNQVTDLQFGRLGKLQKDQDRLDRDRRMLLSAVRRLEGERLAFEAATEEELLALAVAKSEKGSLYLLVCKRCGYRETCQLGTEQYISTIRSCPCCYATLVQRDLAVDLKRRRRTIELVQVHGVQ